MYDFIVIRQNQKAKILSLCLFVSSLVLFACGGYRGFSFRWLFQALSFSLLAGAILVFGRFLARCYAYRIEQGGEGYEFFVDEITRQNRVCVCRLLLSDLMKAETFDKSLVKKGEKLYSYTVDLLPERSLLLTFRDGQDEEHPILLRVCPDEKGEDILKSFLNKGE